MSDDTTTHLPVAGLDVHAASIRLAVVLKDELLDERTLPFDCQLVERELRRRGVARVCYEAGPTGFGLARHLRDAGLQCDVIAPGLVPRRSSDRVEGRQARRTQAGAALPGRDARADLGAEPRAGGRA